MRKYSFAPIINHSCRVLLLGSMPGEESIRQQQYYANPRNQFWKMIYQLYNTEMDSDYKRKTEFLLSKQIALWDVIESCKREGSLDANIEEVLVNDFHRLYEQYPNIEYICFNGQKAYMLYMKFVKQFAGKSFYRLDSTSPANTKSFEAKMDNWRMVSSLLDG